MYKIGDRFECIKDYDYILKGDIVVCSGFTYEGFNAEACLIQEKYYEKRNKWNYHIFNKTLADIDCIESNFKLLK